MIDHFIPCDNYTDKGRIYGVSHPTTENQYLPWLYQKCTEFGWFHTLDQPDHPYGYNVPLEIYDEVIFFTKYTCPKIS